MQTLHVLVNPHAGGGRAARLVPALRDWGGTLGTPLTVLVADSVPQALAWLQTLPPGATVALVGGDGTVNQMLPALLQGHLKLALVPQGSGNDVARALGVAGMHWREALRWAMQATPRPVDVGWLHTDTLQRPFLSSLTVGFDSAVGFKALHGPRWLRGLPRYLLATVRELAALHTWDMEVLLDGAPVHTGSTLFASTLNTPTYGSGMPAVPHAQIDDGALDALIAGDFNRLQAIAMLPRLLLGRHLGLPGVHNRRFQHMQIRSQQALPLATDGEYVGEASHLEVRVSPAALQVLRH
jgi:diacylglycerol kinase family enzyme